MVWTKIAIDILLFIYVLDCAFMGLVILMQRSKQEGLGAAFGGGLTESMWGAQTSNVLVKATVWATILFFVLSITLARLYSHQEALSAKGSSFQQLLEKPVAPVTPAPTVAPATTPAAPAATPAVPSATPTAPAPAKASAPAAPTAPAPAKS
jgi:preprotein translocase subunit SecG